MGMVKQCPSCNADLTKPARVRIVTDGWYSIMGRVSDEGIELHREGLELSTWSEMETAYCTSCEAEIDLPFDIDPTYDDPRWQGDIVMTFSPEELALLIAICGGSAKGFDLTQRFYRAKVVQV